MEDHFGITITDEYLKQSIKVSNETRRLLADLNELRKKENPPVTGEDMQRIVVASLSLPKHIVNPALAELVEQLKETEIERKFRGRVLLMGSQLDDPEYVHAIEERGALVVADAHCFGSHHYSDMVEEDTDPLAALSKRYLDKLPCPRMFDDYPMRYKRVVETAREFGARGIIIQAMKFCDVWGIEANVFRDNLRDEGFHVLKLERETTEVLLELMAEEQDRGTRIFYLDLLKDVGRNQIALLGELLTHGRWYFVRNIVSVLGESKTDQAIAFLRKAADHKNVRIRQEVIKGLLTIGGKKAASILAKLLRDKDISIQMTAIHALAAFPGIGTEESKPLVAFLEDRPLKKKEQELTLEAIKALGKIGGREEMDFLKKYSIIKWWKPRKLQKDLKGAAEQAVVEITRREGDGGRTTR